MESGKPIVNEPIAAMQSLCRLAVLMTCHNRVESTLRCLSAIEKQQLPWGVSVAAYLVDDGCTDGTAEAVRRLHPWVTVLAGSGGLFWCGGMRVAFAEAVRQDFDFYLWLNDDTTLHEHAIGRLVSVHQTPPTIVVGTTTDPDTGRPSYGGVIRRCAWHPFRFTMVRPAEIAQPCHTMNGNCVLVPRAVTNVVGNMDPAFYHGFGDYDYGLRARRAGFAVTVAPGTIGTCIRNRRRLPWRDPSLSRRQRWASVVGPKGLPPREMLVYARRHGGLLWPLFWCMPYVRALLLPTRLRLALGEPL